MSACCSKYPFCECFVNSIHNTAPPKAENVQRSGPSKNKPCICGSKKNFKNCCMKKVKSGKF